MTKLVDEVIAELSERYADRYVSNRSFRIAIEGSYPLAIPSSIGMDILDRFGDRLYKSAAKRVLRSYMMKLLRASASDMLREIETERERTEDKLRKMSREVRKKEKTAATRLAKVEQRKKHIENYLKNRMEMLEDSKRAELSEVKENYRRMARKDFEEELTQSLERSGMLESRPSRLKYNPDVLVARLSNLLLDDILEKAGQDVRDGYRALTSGKAGVEFTGRGVLRSDIPPRGVDWVATKRAAMEAGRDYIEESDLIVRYPESEQLIKAVIATDVSHSMGEPDVQKLRIAKQTALALGSMITQLNRDNTVTYIAFADENRVVSAAKLYMMSTGYGTNIGGALKKSHRTLEDGLPDRLGLVYLISDCSVRDSGYTLESALAGAEPYAVHDNYYLRIFLIDPDEETKINSVQIARKAGNNSRIVPASWRNVDVEAIIDFVDLFKGIYKPEEMV